MPRRRALVLAIALTLIAGPLPAPARSPGDLDADRAVRRALDFLKATQKPDGAWESGGFGKATSVTSLAVLAFLAAGHVPGEPGPHRDAVERGIRYVLAHQKPNGLLTSNTSHGPMYCHGISTLMLAEVVGMSADPELAEQSRTALARAVDLILKAQDLPKGKSQEGGWRYQPSSRDSDLSVTGWQVMALRAAKAAGCNVPSSRIDKALGYVRRCAVKDGGGFGYQPGGGANNPRTGTGILALEICGDRGTPEAKAGADYLIKHPPKWSNEYFFYEAYYCSQASFQAGGKCFAAYHPKLTSILLERQEADGSWLSPDGYDRSGGRPYCTAMGVLALAVEYRYLPIYQK